MADNIVYVVMVGTKFVRKKSYSNFSLVEHPENASLYSRKTDADARRKTVEYYIREFRKKLLGEPVKLVKLRLSYEIVDESVK